MYLVCTISFSFLGAYILLGLVRKKTVTKPQITKHSLQEQVCIISQTHCYIWPSSFPLSSYLFLHPKLFDFPERLQTLPSTSAFIPCQWPVLAIQGEIKIYKYDKKKTRRGRRGKKRKPGPFSGFFLSSGRHLDIYRNPMHNHFSIFLCLQRLVSKR